MNRIVLSLSIALIALAPAARAWADEAPTKEQIDAAKKAFGEGKQLHDEGKLGDAIEKFKESYRLSRNPVLLYNIALTLDENKQTDSALFYYRKFLSDAPADAAQRKTADDRVKVLENAKLEADLAGKPADPTTPSTNTPAKTEPPPKVKPAGTYGPADFQHQVVEEAPPGKALDISAFVPEDSGFTVTLYFRDAGSSEFTAKTMKWHYKELVARIPAAKVVGSSIQYYIEVKDQAGTVVTRSGKSTSPNLVNLDAAAPQKYFPDFTDDSAGQAPKEAPRHHDDEDPLHPSQEPVEQTPIEQPPEVVGPPGVGFTDVGSSKFEYVKWGSTIGAVALIGLGVTFNVMAGKQADALVSDSTTPHGSCTQTPCKFDSYDQDLESAGQRDQTISNIGIGVGIVGAVVAGYFWYRELKSPKHHEVKGSARNAAPPTPTFVIAPTMGQDYHGAAAAVRF